MDPAGFDAGFGPDARGDCAKPNGTIAKNAMEKMSLLIFVLVIAVDELCPSHETLRRAGAGLRAVARNIVDKAAA